MPSIVITGGLHPSLVSALQDGFERGLFTKGCVLNSNVETLASLPVHLAKRVRGGEGVESKVLLGPLFCAKTCTQRSIGNTFFLESGLELDIYLFIFVLAKLPFCSRLWDV